jgi:4-hydroxybenzoate polyprenyltransferase
MKILSAFFRLIRWPNLVFIIITQVLFYYCIYIPQLKETPTVIFDSLFYLLVLASVLIAAAGYIINDYFDIQIDAINKPERMVMNKYIKRRWAIVWHLVFSIIGVALSFYVSYTIKVWPIFFINIGCVVALYFYSTTFKKKLLIGNLIIAALTGWVILDVYLFAGAEILSLKGFVESNLHINARRFFKFTILYVSFSFVSTLIREVIKDLEDMEGDRRYNCNTMPIAWGIPASKVFVAVWIIVSIAGLLGILLYAWLSGWWFAAVYVLFFIVLPYSFLLYKLMKAIYTRDYKALSTTVKFIMLAGILSMVIIKIFG